jgi:hypothetical protein
VSKPYFPDPPKPAAQSPFRERGHGAASSEAPAAEPVVVRRVEPVEDRFAPIAPTPTLRASKPVNPAAARLAAERNPGNPKVEAMSPESRRELANTLIAVDKAHRPFSWRGALGLGLSLVGLHATGLTTRFSSRSWDYWYVWLLAGLVFGYLEMRWSRKQLGL